MPSSASSIGVIWWISQNRPSFRRRGSALEPLDLARLSYHRLTSGFASSFAFFVVCFFGLAVLLFSVCCLLFPISDHLWWSSLGRGLPREVFSFFMAASNSFSLFHRLDISLLPFDFICNFLDEALSTYIWRVRKIAVNKVSEACKQHPEGVLNVLNSRLKPVP